MSAMAVPRARMLFTFEVLVGYQVEVTLASGAAYEGVLHCGAPVGDATAGPPNPRIKHPTANHRRVF